MGSGAAVGGPIGLLVAGGGTLAVAAVAREDAVGIGC